MTVLSCIETPVGPGGPRDRYHSLRVQRIVEETADARSIVFDLPSDLVDRFAYRPGQFVTLRVVTDHGPQLRSYSMSSAPSLDADLQVTVKRVPGGRVSNWLNDALSVGEVLGVSEPTGMFVLTDSQDDIVAFAGGSGITPVFSIVKAALHTTARRLRLLFANHERSQAIFGDALDDLAARFPGRLVVQHHEDVTGGFVGAHEVGAFVGHQTDAEFLICGPTGFMDVVETALHGADVDPARIHVERFTPASANAAPIHAAPPDDVQGQTSVTITIGTRTETIEQRGNSTILQSARWVGLPAPSSCEAGHCATCMARVLEGVVEMANNEVLTQDEVDEGWVLTCQAVPVTRTVRVVYE